MSDSDGSEGYDDSPAFLDEEGDAMALGIGLGEGFRRLDPRPGKHKSTAANPFYYYPGFIIGYLLKIGALVLVAQFGLGAA